MELPFLKNKHKNNGGGAQQAETIEESYNKQLLEHSVTELMDAFHKKDIRGLRSALKAVYHSIKGE